MGSMKTRCARSNPSSSRAMTDRHHPTTAKCTAKWSTNAPRFAQRPMGSMAKRYFEHCSRKGSATRVRDRQGTSADEDRRRLGRAPRCGGPASGGCIDPACTRKVGPCVDAFEGQCTDSSAAEVAGANGGWTLHFKQRARTKQPLSRRKCPFNRRLSLRTNLAIHV